MVWSRNLKVVWNGTFKWLRWDKHFLTEKFLPLTSIHKAWTDSKETAADGRWPLSQRSRPSWKSMRPLRKPKLFISIPRWLFLLKPNKLHFIAHSVQVPLTTVKNCRRLPPTAHFTSNNGAPREVRKWRLGCWKAEQKSWLTHRAEELKLDSKTCWGFCSQPKRPPSHQ